jgi:hypothetical protein
MAKQPYMNSGHILDPESMSIRLSADAQQTQVTAFRKSGDPEGQIRILGDSALPDKFQSDSSPAVELAEGKVWVSDCNGMIKMVTPVAVAPTHMPMETHTAAPTHMPMGIEKRSKK